MKAKDKNKVMLIISALMIVIAIIITCVAAGYEYKMAKEEKGTENPKQVQDTAKKDEAPNSNKTTMEAKASETTKNGENTSAVETGAGKYKVATKNDPLSIRRVPDGEMIYEIPKGVEITIQTVYGEWGYVTYDDVSGWVAMQYTELISKDGNTSDNTTGKYKIATQDDPLGIRVKPAQDAERNGEIPKGETIEIVAINGDWGYVEYNDLQGWLSFEYLEKVS